MADTGNHRIQKFTAKGQFLAAVGTKGNRPLQFNEPTDIAFNAVNSKVYATEWKHYRCHILNSDLTFSSTFGKQGSDEGHFTRPDGIACDSTGKVYVADSWSHRIQVFIAEGKFLMKFGRRGGGRGELNGPVGIVTSVCH